MPASPAQKEMECRYAGTVSTIRQLPGEADTARGTVTITTTVHRRTDGKGEQRGKMANSDHGEFAHIITSPYGPLAQSEVDCWRETRYTLYGHL